MIPVLGLDLSLTSTGVAVVSVGGDIATWTVTTGTARGVPRQQIILNGIRDAVARHRPAIVAIEAIYAGPNRQTTIALAKLHGVVEFWLHRRGLPYVTVQTEHIKTYVLGYGTRSKQGDVKKLTVTLAVERRFGELVKVTCDDEADALILAAMALDQYGAPLTPMPQAHRAALTKIVWPVLGRPDNPPTPGGGAGLRPAAAREPSTTSIGA